MKLAVVLAATAALFIGTAQASGKTYIFVNIETKQQIRAECSADPKGRSANWWKANCRPFDQNARNWTGKQHKQPSGFPMGPDQPPSAGKMNIQAKRPPSLLLSLGVLCLATLPATAQDSIVQMCETAAQVAPEYANNCECALTAIKNEISGDQFDIYAAVGSRYFKNMASGLDRADAWDAAAKSVGEEREMSLVDVLEITNPIGRLHAQAIKDCGS